MTATVQQPAVIAQQSSGTFLNGISTLGATYTIGRDFAPRVALELADRAPYLGADIETEGTGAAAMFLKAVTFATADHAVILDPRDPLQADAIRQVFEVGSAFVFHGSCFDVPLLIRNGLMSLAAVAKVWDTLMYARMANPSDRGGNRLGECAATYLGTSRDDHLHRAMKALGLSRSTGYKVFDLDRPVYVFGAAIDGIVTARLAPLVRAAALARLTTGHPFTHPIGLSLEEARRLVDREQKINRMFLRRTARGLRVDLDHLDTYRDAVGQDQAARRELLGQYGIRETVGADLMTWLDDRGRVPETYRRTPKTGAMSASAPDLKKLLLTLTDDPEALALVSAYVTLKEVTHVDKDYLAKVVDLADEHGRIHPEVKILAAATGRMSMGTPPLHQFPGDELHPEDHELAGQVKKRGARGIVLADEGDSLTSIDWSAIEPVVAANLAKERRLIEQYESGGDFYTTVAEMAGGIKRKQAKVVLLAQMYGEGPKKLAYDLGMTEDAAYELNTQIFKALPKLDNHLWRLKKIARAHRLSYTISGRIIPVPMGTYNGEISVQGHKGPNYHIQGSAYDVLAEALLNVEAAGLGDAVYVAMHDELVCSTEAAPDIQKLMEVPPERLCQQAGRVPVLRTDKADLGERWAAA